VSVQYSKLVMEHFDNPRNVGSLDRSSPRVGTGIVAARDCGDVIKLQIEVADDGRIVDARFKTFGCGPAIAAGSLTTEWLKGRTIDQACKLRNSYIAERLQLPPRKMHCSVMAEDAVKAAVEDWRRKCRCAGLARGPDAAP
jgi:nitrogen fixation NifU-like protein